MVAELWKKVMDNFRESRTKKFKRFAQFFPKIGITANRMTCISLCFGILAAYFLFRNHLWFVILGILHLLCDGLDGVIARYTQPTKFGKYFDFISDRIIALLLMFQLFWHLQDYYVLITMALMLITHGINLLTKFNNHSLYTRTIIIIGLFISPLWSGFLILTYLVIGIISLYSLTLQFRRYLSTLPGRYS